MAVKARFNFLATTAVVPEPEKGSKIKSFSRVEARIIFARSFSGFCVGCSVFSGIDQNGTVKSVHKFDGVSQPKISLVGFFPILRLAVFRVRREHFSL